MKIVLKLTFTSLVFAFGWTSMAAEGEKLPGPLFDGLGHLSHPVTVKSKSAQRYFDQGLTLIFAFNHKEAIRSFRSAAKLDPECAMAWWGVAYAYGPHVNKPMSKEDNDQAWAAIKEALKLQSGATPHERAYIKAMAARYQAEHPENRSALDKAYAAAMRDLVKEYPDDLDAQAMFAEALMDTMPWDYWTKDRSPKPETEEALAALKYVIAHDPNHPGANHFYIHAVEAGPNPELGLPAADRLGGFAPDAGHLVHMPSHIYLRVGQYHDAVIANEKAAKADRAYIRHCTAQGFYPGVYYPHNVHFLWYAEVFEGRSADAVRTANRASEYALENYCGPNRAFEAPRLRHLPWITLARFGRWDEVLKLPQPANTNDFLMDRAMWHFARGLAFAARGQGNEAATESTELGTLAHGDEAKKLDNPHFPATKVLELADLLLAGKTAGARGEKRQMVEKLEAAVAAEDAMPYMEPAYWPFPTRPTLGAALLRAGDAAKAEQLFREDLKRFPRNGWGLFGLEQSLRAQGKSQQADLVKRQLQDAWQYSDVRLDLAWL